MPLSVKHINGMHRLVEADTGRIAVTKNGKPRDGGGHVRNSLAQKQAGIINAAIAKKAEKKP